MRRAKILGSGKKLKMTKKSHSKFLALEIELFSVAVREPSLNHCFSVWFSLEDAADPASTCFFLAFQCGIMPTCF